MKPPSVTGSVFVSYTMKFCHQLYNRAAGCQQNVLQHPTTTVYFIIANSHHHQSLAPCVPGPWALSEKISGKPVLGILSNRTRSHMVHTVRNHISNICCCYSHSKHCTLRELTLWPATSQSVTASVQGLTCLDSTINAPTYISSIFM